MLVLHATQKKKRHFQDRDAAAAPRSSQIRSKTDDWVFPAALWEKENHMDYYIIIIIWVLFHTCRHKHRNVLLVLNEMSVFLFFFLALTVYVVLGFF